MGSRVPVENPSRLSCGVSQLVSLIRFLYILIQLCSITSQPPAGAPATPRVRKPTRPASTLLLWNILGRSEACTVCFVSISTFIGAKIPLDCSWSLDVIPSPLESWVQSGEEVVKVSGKDTASLLQRSCRSTHNQGECEHGPRQQLNRYLEDDKMGFLATIVLCESINERKHESLCEDSGTKEETARYLFTGQFAAYAEH